MNPGQALGDRLHYSGVQAAETSHRRFQSGLNFSKSGETPDSHQIVVEQTVVEPKEKTPNDMMLSSEEESTHLPFIAERSKSWKLKCQMWMVSVIEIILPGYEWYASVTCSTWLKKARQIQNRTQM